MTDRERIQGKIRQIEERSKIDLTHFEDKSVHGPCVFQRVKEEQSLLFCRFEAEHFCGTEDVNLSECDSYSILGEKLIKQTIRHITMGCDNCQKVKFDGEWLTREEIFIPDIQGPIPPDIWEKLWKQLLKECCPECQPDKKGENKDKFKGGLS